MGRAPQSGVSSNRETGDVLVWGAGVTFRERWNRTPGIPYNTCASKRVLSRDRSAADRRGRGVCCGDGSGGHSGMTLRESIESGTVFLSQDQVFVGLAEFDGYLPERRGVPATARQSFPYRRSHEKATAGYLQSGTGPSSHRERSHWRAPHVPVVQWVDRTLPRSLPAAAALSCDTDVYCLRQNRPLYCGSSLVGIRSFARSSCSRARSSPSARVFFFAEGLAGRQAPASRSPR